MRNLPRWKAARPVCADRVLKRYRDPRPVVASPRLPREEAGALCFGAARRRTQRDGTALHIPLGLPRALERWPLALSVYPVRRHQATSIRARPRLSLARAAEDHRPREPVPTAVLGSRAPPAGNLRVDARRAIAVGRTRPSVLRGRWAPHGPAPRAALAFFASNRHWPGLIGAGKKPAEILADPLDAARGRQSQFAQALRRIRGAGRLIIWRYGASRAPNGGKRLLETRRERARPRARKRYRRRSLFRHALELSPFPYGSRKLLFSPWGRGLLRAVVISPARYDLLVDAFMRRGLPRRGPACRTGRAKTFPVHPAPAPRGGRRVYPQENPRIDSWCRSTGASTAGRARA